MKASELRIGNWIKDHGETGLCYQVSEITEDGFTAGAMTVYPAGMCFDFGIPLTPEWLEKFGFKSGGTWDDYDVWNKYYYTLVEKEDCIEVHSMDDFIARVEHVHSLQNLFFALTEEELTIDKDEQEQQHQRK